MALTSHGYIKIRTAKLGQARALARVHGLIIDNMLGGLGQTMEIKARHCGPLGNHEPEWTSEQRAMFERLLCCY
jgi:hypothetical protein